MGEATTTARTAQNNFCRRVLTQLPTLRPDPSERNYWYERQHTRVAAENGDQADLRLQLVRLRACVLEEDRGIVDDLLAEQEGLL